MVIERLRAITGLHQPLPYIHVLDLSREGWVWPSVTSLYHHTVGTLNLTLTVLRYAMCYCVCVCVCVTVCVCCSSVEQ